MPKALTPAEVQQYEDDGYVCPIPVLTTEQAATYLAAANDLEQRMGPPKPRPTDMNQSHMHLRWSYDLATNPKVLDAVEDVLGPNIVIWGTSLFPKHPHDPAFISWHQDGTYWNLDSTEVVTAWIALSNSTVANGCMRVVRNSHQLEYKPHTENPDKDNLLSRGQEIQVEVDEDQAVDLVLKPGEMSLHHVKTIHGSNANHCDEKRVGYAIRYIAPKVRREGPRIQAVLARGRDEYEHFDLVAKPPQSNIEDAIVALKKSAAEFLTSVMQK
jgi:non-heme Fe2+,alpha-ketoglutarate-dependent halogenase